MKLVKIIWITGLFFLCALLTAKAQTIIRAEYFFDADPGLGQGKSLPVTAGETVDITTEIATEELPTGFHMLYVRFLDRAGHWSVAEGRPFLIDQRPSSPNLAIAKAEYFIDVDPGAGKGKEIPVTPGGQVDLVTEINTEGLAGGFHTLYVRLKDGLGHWSLVEGRPFFIDKITGTLATIVAAEYYFGEEDPGQGKGNPLAITSGAQVELEKQVDISGLALGKHRLNLRFQDNKGAWGYVEIQEFTIALPRVDTITPASGGNIGNVTVNILGASFDEGTVVRLTGNGQPDIVVPDSMMGIINGEQIQATLDLKGKAEGLYNVVVTLANGKVLTLPNSFTVEKGIEPAPWVEVLGFDIIRPGQWQTYTITYGNKGNVDAVGVPLNIIIGLDTTTEVKLDFELLRPSSYGEDFPFDSISVFFNTDSLFGEPYLAKVYPLFISNIPGNSVNTMTIQVKAGTDIELMAFMDAPLYNQQKLNLANPDSPFFGEGNKDWLSTVVAGKRRGAESDFNI